MNPLHLEVQSGSLRCGVKNTPNNRGPLPYCGPRLAVVHARRFATDPDHGVCIPCFEGIDYMNPDMPDDGAGSVLEAIRWIGSR